MPFFLGQSENCVPTPQNSAGSSPAPVRAAGYARAGVLGEVEDVHLAVGQNDPHADGRVAEAIDVAFRVGHRIVLQSSIIQQNIELARGGIALGHVCFWPKAD